MLIINYIQPPYYPSYKTSKNMPNAQSINTFREKFLSIGTDKCGTHKRFAELLDLSQSYMSKISTQTDDEFNPSYAVLVKFFTLTGVSPALFFENLVPVKETSSSTHNIDRFTTNEELRDKVLAIAQTLYESDYAFCRHLAISKGTLYNIKLSESFNPSMKWIINLIKKTQIPYSYIFNGDVDKDDILESFTEDIFDSDAEAENFFAYLDDVTIDHKNVKIMTAVQVKLDRLLALYTDRN